MKSELINIDPVSKSAHLLRCGIGIKKVKKIIRTDLPGITESALTEILSEAKRIIKDSQFTEVRDIISIHTDRYNKLISKLISTRDGDDLSEVEGKGIDVDRYYRMRERKIKNYLDCIATMVQKEELLQYHNKDFVIEINTEETITLKDSKPKYDIKKISFDERKRALNYMLKMKKTANDLLAITQGNNGHVETIDVTHQVIPEIPNISFIRNEASPIANIVALNRDPLVRLKEIQAKLVAKRIKEVGGTLTDEEENLIKSQ